jgi:sn-glycerol 3-phosphate transport system permease protein
LATWNQYLWPARTITDDDWNTVQSSLRVLAAANIDRPNQVMAGTIIVAMPVAIILGIFQKQLIRGLTAGAVKG